MASLRPSNGRGEIGVMALSLSRTTKEFKFSHHLLFQILPHGLQPISQQPKHETADVLPSPPQLPQNSFSEFLYLNKVRPPASPKITGVCGGTWKYPFPFCTLFSCSPFTIIGRGEMDHTVIRPYRSNSVQNKHVPFSSPQEIFEICFIFFTLQDLCTA